jgi:hypothetical protein
MKKNRILLVPEFTELEWAIKPRLEEWAEVATYDSPGVGTESVSDDELEAMASDAVLRRERVAERGLEEVSRREWERFVVVADGGGIPPASRLAADVRPGAVAGIALGHASLSLEHEGRRAPIHAEVQAALLNLIDRDREEFVRHALTQLTGGSYDEELAGRILERVPLKLLTRGWLQGGDEPADRLIGGLDCPLLLVKHEGCLMFTEEGFDDAVRALPRAQTGVVVDKPSVSAEFAELLREFCERLPR